MSGLHGAEIDCLLSRALGNAPSYMGNAVRWLGVFARDELPDLKKERRPFALVLNTDPRSKPGQHWLALYGPKQGPIELFDSFGLPPRSYGLANFSLTYSRIQLQSSFSAVCGHYAIYFICNRSSKQNSFYSIIDSLRKHYVPDNYVYRFIQTLQQTYRILSPCNQKGQCCKLKCSFC